MFAQYSRFWTTRLAATLLLIACSCELRAIDTYIIDADESQFTYGASPWFSHPCDVVCTFSLSGSFTASVGGASVGFSDVSFSLSGPNSELDELQALPAQRFPTRAVLVQQLPTAGQFRAEPTASMRGDTLRFLATQDARPVDGDAYSFNILAHSSNALDCDSDDSVDFDDLACLGDASQIRTVLNVSGSPLGDIDGDQQVGFADFLVLSENFGQAGNYLTGDIDLDGTVGFGDFLELSQTFGVGSGAAIQSVPEPTLAPMLFVASLAILTIRRRQDQ